MTLKLSGVATILGTGRHGPVIPVPVPASGPMSVFMPFINPCFEDRRRENRAHAIIVPTEHYSHGYPEACEGRAETCPSPSPQIPAGP